MSDAPRYRVENAEAIVDVRVESIDHLFDHRDPAPFRERDLDPGLVEYLVGAAYDVSRADKVRLLFWIEQPCDHGEVENGVHAHFEYELARIQRRRREQVRYGWAALAVAACAVVALMSLSELIGRWLPGTLGSGVKEGLVISGWVLMWRPIELLVYDGIPYRRERRALRALRDAAVEIRTGAATTDEARHARRQASTGEEERALR